MNDLNKIPLPYQVAKKMINMISKIEKRKRRSRKTRAKINGKLPLNQTMNISKLKKII